MTWPMRAGAFAETLAQFFRTLRQLRQTFEQRAKIKSSANGENRQFRPGFYVRKNPLGALTVVAGCGRFVQQVMRNFRAFRSCRLGRADIESAIELRRIARDNLTVELFCERDA